MEFLVAFLSAIAVFLIYQSVMEIVQNKREERFALYDEVTDVFAEDVELRSIDERSFLEKIEVMLHSANIPVDMQEFIIMNSAAYIFAAIIFGSFTGNIVFGALLGVLPSVGFYFYMQMIIKSRNKRVIAQLPDFAIMFASGYQAGYSIENCFDYTASQLKYPINQEMQEIYTDITDRKLNFKAALNNWYERNPNPDVLFVIKGLLLCAEKSGNVTTIMKSLQEKLRDRALIDRFVEKKTQSMKYLAKFIQIMPILAVAVSYMNNPVLFMAFITSLFGIVASSISVGFYIIGSFMISRFIKKVYED